MAFSSKLSDFVNVLQITLFLQGRESVSGVEIAQQPKTLTAIYLHACQSVWSFYASLIFCLSLEGVEIRDWLTQPEENLPSRVRCAV